MKPRPLRHQTPLAMPLAVMRRESQTVMMMNEREPRRECESLSVNHETNSPRLAFNQLPRVGTYKDPHNPYFFLRDDGQTSEKDDDVDNPSQIDQIPAPQKPEQNVKLDQQASKGSGASQAPPEEASDQTEAAVGQADAAEEGKEPPTASALNAEGEDTNAGAAPQGETADGRRNQQKNPYRNLGKPAL